MFVTSRPIDRNIRFEYDSNFRLLRNEIFHEFKSKSEMIVWHDLYPKAINVDGAKLFARYSHAISGFLVISGKFFQFEIIRCSTILK